MRLATLALSAALLSGCSYWGGASQTMNSWFSGGSEGAYAAKPSADRCRIPHRQAPIPRGCHPSQVTIGPASQGHPGGFPQTPQFGQPQRYQPSQGGWNQPQQATGGFGNHASGNQHAALHQGGTKPRLRKPRFRASLDLGLDQAVSGNILTNAAAPTTPFASYNPADFNEGRQEGSIADGETTSRLYFANSRLQNTPDPWDDLRVPDVSFTDAWSAPTTIGAGGEFILNDRATLFGRVGYTQSEGTSGGAATIEGTVFEQTTVRNYDELFNLVATSVSTAFRSEQPITEISYDFSDMRRLDLEAGGRVYLNPIAGQATGRTVTPFLGASAGASHYNAVSYTLDQRQLNYASVYEDEQPSFYDLDVPQGFDLDDNPATPGVTRVELYDAQWVATGSLKAGVEWQVTPKTALAFETGVRVEGARDYANGEKGDRRISVPLTLRGSFNF
ncbi:MAG: hypothetical protein AAFP97_03065 [Pseudomonadota bacterium]